MFMLGAIVQCNKALNEQKKLDQIIDDKERYNVKQGKADA